MSHFNPNSNFLRLKKIVMYCTKQESRQDCYCIWLLVDHLLWENGISRDSHLACPVKLGLYLFTQINTQINSLPDGVGLDRIQGVLTLMGSAVDLVSGQPYQTEN